MRKRFLWLTLAGIVNDTTTSTIAGVGCWRLLVGAPDSEVISRPDSNDTRMQQVMWANGKLWGALDTALHRLGRPVLRGRHRRQPAWHVRWRRSRPGLAH